MKKCKVIVKVVIIVLTICMLRTVSYAHAGRTDKNGGHKDKNNVSGLGPYHYHCGGHPAHLHPDGVCPYSSDSKKSSNNSSNSTKEASPVQSTTSINDSQTTEIVKSNIVEATSIQIYDNIRNIQVGNNKKLEAIIKPYNTTNKNIIWKSSDNSIAEVNSKGELIAKKEGSVTIEASTSNGKTSTIKINIENKDINFAGVGTTLSLCALGGYIGYNKYKNK